VQLHIVVHRCAMSRNEGEQKSLPSLATAGSLSACGNFRGRYATQRLLVVMEGCGVLDASRDDFGGDAADTGAGQADRTGSPRGQVEDAATDERTAIIDGHDDAAAAMGDA
jgi:hypothetical protein